MPRLSLTLLSLPFLAGCAGGMPTPSVGPEDIPSLETRHSARPADAPTMLALGVAYYEAGRYAFAKDVLAALEATKPESVLGRIYLARSWVGLGNLDSARAALDRASAHASSGAEREALEGERVVLARAEMARAAREAVARESTLARTAPVPNSVAVFPFRYLGNDESLRPLERGMAYLIVTDLSQVARLRLLEREQVQALVDEMALAESGRVDPTTGARSGRLLKAEHVIQGTLREPEGRTELIADASAVNTSDARVAATGSAQDRLQDLFDIEQSVVMQLLGDLGIPLTPAERRAIGRRPTSDMQAFLAFSRGLEAEDRGDFAAAAEAYAEAERRDPRFGAARSRQQQSRRLAIALRDRPLHLAARDFPALRSPLTDLRLSDRSGALRDLVMSTVPGASDRLGRRLATRPPAVRRALAEALRQDDVRVTSQLGEIIILVVRP